jgi:multidrug efflux pump subunit AcrA (membrane-fusion protein)
MVFHDAPLAKILDAGIVVVMLVLDNGFIGVKARRQVVTLDTVYPDEGELRRDLESRLGGKVKRLFVKETDYVRETTVVDVRYVPVTRTKGSRPWRRTEARDLHEVIA